MAKEQRITARFKANDGTIKCSQYKSYNGCTSHSGACKWEGAVRNGQCIRT